MQKGSLTHIEHHVDFCVIGGGLAGICAAIAAARDGSKVVLMHERPMLGGNASSEVRMWVCGAKESNNRETGIIEEIMLENLYRNPHKNYYIWDSILYEKVRFEPNIELLLNCSCCDAKTDGSKIVSATGWQMTTQSWHTVYAKYFADCSGDSILAPLTGAQYRMGREAASEYHEQIAQIVADSKTMGMSCLIQASLSDKKIRFVAPDWAVKLTPEIIALRKPQLNRPSENFWYLELGGEQDTIADTETIRDELLALAYGMWDYIKNSGEIENADYWQLDFVGILPGKRESRRLIGKYVMTSNDVMRGGHFDDNVAYGGWPLDDHPPEGFYYKGKPNTWNDTPSPYGIPYRCLYSNNIENLFFAGRNISMTHAAMSSARVMATCAILGEAVGTAANIAREFQMTPHEVYLQKIRLLQQRLLYKDCFIPYLRREIPELVRASRLSADPAVEQIDNLRNGADRNNRTYGEGEEQGCFCTPGAAIRYELPGTAFVKEVRITFDSDLDRITLPGNETERQKATRAITLPDSPDTHPPLTLVRAFCVSVTLDDGSRITLLREDNNRMRTVHLPVNRTVRGIELVPLKTWGDSENIHIFSFDFI